MLYGQSPYRELGSRRAPPKRNLILKGWNCQAHGEFPGNFESRNLRENLSGEIGRTPTKITPTKIA